MCDSTDEPYVSDEGCESPVRWERPAWWTPATPSENETLAMLLEQQREPSVEAAAASLDARAQVEAEVAALTRLQPSLRSSLVDHILGNAWRPQSLGSEQGPGVGAPTGT